MTILYKKPVSMQEGGVQARWTDPNKLKNLPAGTYKTNKMEENEAYIMANPDHYVQSTTNTAPLDIVQPNPGTPFKATASYVPVKVASGDAGGLNSRSTINKTTTEFKPTEDTSTAWANTWGTNKDRYNSEINSLTPWQQGQLRDDVLADNPNVIGMEQYKNDLPKFIEEATNDKVGVVHNAIAARQPKLLRSQDVKLGITGDPGLVPMKRPTIPTESTTPNTGSGTGIYDPDRPRAKGPVRSYGIDFVVGRDKNIKTKGTYGFSTDVHQEGKNTQVNGRTVFNQKDFDKRNNGS